MPSLRPLRPGRRAAGGLAALAMTTACDRTSPSGPPAPPAATAPCQRTYATKVGVPFVRICPADLPGIILEPFWISAAPVGCTAGAHETIGCPPVLPLQAEARDPIQARTAMVIDAVTAHRTCGLRFNGRLPTTLERARARDALGLATVLVTQADGGDTYQPLAEWTTEAPCTEPSTLGASCHLATFPEAAAPEVPWATTRTCTATPTATAGALVVELGDACPPGQPGAPACVLAAPAADAHARGAFAVRCTPPGAEPAPHPDAAGVRTAAFRCVVPDEALIGMTTADRP